MTEKNINQQTKLKVLITDVQKRLDKNQKDYWIIRILIDKEEKSYLAFSGDRDLVPKTLSLLMNYSNVLKGRNALLTVRQIQDRSKVVEIEVEKE